MHSSLVPWLGIAHSDQPAQQEPGNEATAESARSAFLSHLAKSAKKFYPNGKASFFFSGAYVFRSYLGEEMCTLKPSSAVASCAS